ncbi:MAG TPA: DUF559 domain-containing protein [Povalibacter sp.]|nr:DUF559 domain-containing protein [Povalibacter sp.]
MRNKLAQERARTLRRSPTDAERRLWHYLRRRHLHGARFRRQFSIGPFIVDFVSLDAMLVIELDGSQHQAAIAYDAHRSRFLKQRGFRILRFWDNEVLAKTEAVLEVIGRVLEEAPIPTFPASGGRGRERAAIEVMQSPERSRTLVCSLLRLRGSDSGAAAGAQGMRAGTGTGGRADLTPSAGGEGQRASIPQ